MFPRFLLSYMEQPKNYKAFFMIKLNRNDMTRSSKLLGIKGITLADRGPLLFFI